MAIGRKRKIRGAAWATGRARRNARIRASAMRSLGSVYRFKEWYDGGVTSLGAASSQGYVLSTQLASLNNIGNFVGLYDLYKITGMKVTFVPTHNVSDFSQGAGTALPMLYVAPNRDPYVPAPVGIADILNDDGVKIIRFTRPVSFYIKNPKADIFDKDGNSLPFQFNSTSKALQPWLTTGGNQQTVNQSALKHYGFRYFVDNNGNLAQPVAWQIFVKLYVSFKEQD